MAPYFCREHRKPFFSASNYDAHLRSKAHAGTPFKCNCDSKGFPSPAALLLHFETNTCSWGARLHELIHLIVLRKVLTGKPWAFNASPLIIGRTALWHEDPLECYEIMDQKRLSSAYYDGAWACYNCNRGFGSTQALAQHLASARTVIGMTKFQCDSCNKAFNLPSALAQHYESRSCC